MVSSVRTDVGQAADARLAAERQRETKRWSLFLSVFGALATSAVLWAGIFLLVGWVGGLAANLAN